MSFRYLKTLAICLFWICLASPLEAATATLAWEPNPEPDITNYIVHIGTAPGVYTTRIPVGITTRWTFMGLADDSPYYFAVQAQNPAGLSPLSAIGYRTPPKVRPGSEQSRSDFNHDGYFDLLWQHHQTGYLAAWHLSGPNLVSGAYLEPSRVTDVNWKIKGSGDLNNDGEPDLVWQNDATGDIAAWLLDGLLTFQTRSIEPGKVADTNWKIASVRDFNGDNQPDLVWQNHATGRLGIWYLNGTNVLAYNSLSWHVPDTTWKIVGSGDLNGDGKADLIWQNHSRGDLAVWFMNGTTVVGTASLTPDKVTDPMWKIQAVGDVNGDGNSDLIWQHDTSRVLAAWYLNGTTVVYSSLLTPSVNTDVNWKIAGPR